MSSAEEWLSKVRQLQSQTDQNDSDQLEQRLLAERKARQQRLERARSRSRSPAKAEEVQQDETEASRGSELAQELRDTTNHLYRVTGAASPASQRTKESASTGRITIESNQASKRLSREISRADLRATLRASSPAQLPASASASSRPASPTRHGNDMVNTTPGHETISPSESDRAPSPLRASSPVRGSKGSFVTSALMRSPTLKSASSPGVKPANDPASLIKRSSGYFSPPSGSPQARVVHSSNEPSKEQHRTMPRSGLSLHDLPSRASQPDDAQADSLETPAPTTPKIPDTPGKHHEDDITTPKHRHILSPDETSIPPPRLSTPLSSERHAQAHDRFDAHKVLAEMKGGLKASPSMKYQPEDKFKDGILSAKGALKASSPERYIPPDPFKDGILGAKGALRPASPDRMSPEPRSPIPRPGSQESGGSISMGHTRANVPAVTRKGVANRNPALESLLKNPPSATKPRASSSAPVDAASPSTGKSDSKDSVQLQHMTKNRARRPQRKSRQASSSSRSSSLQNEPKAKEPSNTITSPGMVTAKHTPNDSSHVRLREEKSYARAQSVSPSRSSAPQSVKDRIEALKSQKVDSDPTYAPSPETIAAIKLQAYNAQSAMAGSPRPISPVREAAAPIGRHKKAFAETQSPEVPTNEVESVLPSTMSSPKEIETANTDGLDLANDAGSKQFSPVHTESGEIAGSTKVNEPEVDKADTANALPKFGASPFGKEDSLSKIRSNMTFKFSEKSASIRLPSFDFQDDSMAKGEASSLEKEPLDDKSANAYEQSSRFKERAWMKHAPAPLPPRDGSPVVHKPPTSGLSDREHPSSSSNEPLDAGNDNQILSNPDLQASPGSESNTSSSAIENRAESLDRLLRKKVDQSEGNVKRGNALTPPVSAVLEPRESSRPRGPRPPGSRSRSVSPVRPDSPMSTIPPRLVASPRLPSSVTHAASKVVPNFLRGLSPTRKQDYMFDIPKIVSEKASDTAHPERSLLYAQSWSLQGDSRPQPCVSEEQHYMHNSETRVVLYYYIDHEGQEKSIIFEWRGQKSQVPEDTAARFISRLQREHALSTVVRVPQGKETGTLLRALGGTMVVMASESSKAERLFVCRRVKQSLIVDEVPVLPASLCSAYSYILQKPRCTIVWHGLGSVHQERSGALSIALEISGSRVPRDRIFEVREEKEPGVFWESFPKDLPTDYASASYWKYRSYDPPGLQTRVFTLRSNFSIEEIHDATQTDLRSENVYVVDAYFEVYVLIGFRARTNTKAIDAALSFAKQYISYMTSGKANGRPLEPLCNVIAAPSKVPRDFKAIFRYWDDKKSCTAPQAGDTDVLRARSLNMFDLDEALGILTRRQFTLAQVRAGRAIGVSPESADEWLADDDFPNVFGVSRGEYQRLPAEKQQELRSSSALLLKELRI